MNMFEQYMEQHFARTEGEPAVRNLERLAETLGYGHRFGDAIYDFLVDNPGAIEAVLQFVQEEIEINTEWQDQLVEALQDC